MHRPPRPPTSRLFDGWMVVSSVLQGASLLIAVAVMYAVVLGAGTTEPEARAMAFAAIVLGNVGLILSNRSRHATLAETLRNPNRTVWYLVAGAIAGLAIALYVGPVREIFRFAPLGAHQVIISVVTAIVGLAWLELYKLLHRRAPRFAN